MSRNVLLPVLVVLLALAGCRKDFGNASWETGALLPLAHTSLTLNDLLTGVQVQSAPDSFVTLVYENELYAIAPDSLVDIPDTTITNAYNYVFSSFINLAGGDYIVSNQTTQTKYDLGGAELTSVRIRSGGILFSVKSKVEAPIDFTYSLPTATQNGNAFSATVTIPAATATSYGTLTRFFDLSGYEIDLRGTAGDKVNTVVTSTTARISPSFQGTVMVENRDTINSSITFSGIEPDFAIGYFGDAAMDIGPESSPFSIFRQIVGGSMSIEDFKIDLQLENGIGADAQLNITSLASVNERTGVTVPLSHSLIGTTTNIDRAHYINGQLQRTYNSFSLTTQNSNIKQFIENMPGTLQYSLQAKVNPLGNVSGHKDFLAYGEGLKAKLRAELPLSLVANDLALADTIEVRIDEEQGTKISNGKLNLFADNGFPLSAGIKIYIIDDSGNKVDSLAPSPYLIEAAPIDANRKVIRKQLTKMVIPISGPELDALIKWKRLSLITTFNTSGQPGYIKIYSHYNIDLKLTGDFDYELELE